MLFARFDRLLFLARGGKTIYFNSVGEGSHILREYFERNGSAKFPPGVNPAEFMLEVIGAAPGSHSDIDWHQTWLDSPERAAVKEELRHLAANPKVVDKSQQDKWAYTEFAVPLRSQFWEVQKRVFAQYWRTPVYIYSKATLCTLVVRLSPPFSLPRLLPLPLTARSCLLVGTSLTHVSCPAGSLHRLCVPLCTRPARPVLTCLARRPQSRSSTPAPRSRACRTSACILFSCRERDEKLTSSSAPLAGSSPSSSSSPSSASSSSRSVRARLSSPGSSALC